MGRAAEPGIAWQPIAGYISQFYTPPGGTVVNQPTLDQWMDVVGLALLTLSFMCWESEEPAKRCDTFLLVQQQLRLPFLFRRGESFVSGTSHKMTDKRSLSQSCLDRTDYLWSWRGTNLTSCKSAAECFDATGMSGRSHQMLYSSSPLTSLKNSAGRVGGRAGWLGHRHTHTQYFYRKYNNLSIITFRKKSNLIQQFKS